MQTNDVPGAESADVRRKPGQIASWGHFVGLLLIGAAVAGLGLLAQLAPAKSGGAAAGQLASRSQAIPIYLTAIFMDWALLYYCWAGVRRCGGNLTALSGGRWTSWKSVATDLGIALPFWLLLLGAGRAVEWLLGPASAKSAASLMPQSLLEILLWIGTSITAGICEEIVFRGYLLRQIQALSGSVVTAVLGQGLVFGVFHGYQGWKNVVEISVIGVLFGALAVWRRNLRANILAHAWTDVWEGWLSAVVWK